MYIDVLIDLFIDGWKLKVEKQCLRSKIINLTYSADKKSNSTRN